MNRSSEGQFSMTMDEDDSPNAIARIEDDLSLHGAEVFRAALKDNENNALRALGGLSEAYAKLEVSVSAGYRRRRR